MNPIDPTTPATHRPSLPFAAAVEGWSTGSVQDLPNTVSVSVITVETDDEPDAGERIDYADSMGARELVEVDTNYKPERTGQHPVRLTRADAVQLAVHLLQATEDTFHYSRRGPLRGREAAQLLRALEEVDFALNDLRSHALSDLLRDTDVDPDDQPETTSDDATTTPTESTPASSDQPEAAALREVFSVEFATRVQASEAFGALVYRIQERTAAFGVSPALVLRELDPADRAFALRAEDPAAFLAAKVRDLGNTDS
jgi:hypothetical protein